MPKAKKNPLADQSVYPHIKITREKFPRALVTRRLETDDADYFGAFLPATGVRFLLDFLNKVFKLRTCTIEIDGKFDVPCVQFYTKRCVAPCVESLCKQTTYGEIVEAVKLFLSGAKQKFEDSLIEKIECAAGNFEFERAAFWRDILQAGEDFFSDEKFRLRLDDATDTFEIEKTDDGFALHLVAQRGRKTLGRRTLVFDDLRPPEEILPGVIEHFYKFYAPREIRLPLDFPARKVLAKKLSAREKREVKLTVFKTNGRVTSRRALVRAKFENDQEKFARRADAAEISRELKRIFSLKNAPRRIETFDAAHISGSDFVAAKVVWRDGEIVSEDAKFWLSDETSEPAALRAALAENFSGATENRTYLVLIDGGKPQLNAAREVLKNFSGAIVAAVKPPHRHGEIAYFLAAEKAAIKFEDSSEAMQLLRFLRDEAHDLSNFIHRVRRETAHFYELSQLLPSLNEKQRQSLLQKFGSVKNVKNANAEDLKKYLPPEVVSKVLFDLKSGGNIPVKPFIVPVRYDAPRGDAADLRPLPFKKARR